MKKILSIALIAALVLTSAFAASYSGKAEIDLGYNFDSSEYGFKNVTAQNFEVTAEFDTGAASVAGEGDLKAELAAAVKLYAEVEEADDDYTTNPVELTTDLAVKAEITKANIIYKDAVTFGILGAGKSVTYAKAWAKATTTQFDYVKELNGTPGFTVTTSAVKGGFGLTGNAEASTYEVLAWAATAKSLEVADGLKLDAAAAAKLSDSSKTVQGAVKAAYTSDDLSATVAADVQYTVDGALALDTSVEAKVAGVTANVYAGTTNTFDATELDAKVSYALTDPKMSVYAAIYQALDDSRKVGAGCEATFDAVKVSEDVVYGIKDTAIESTTKCTYTADAFVVEGKFVVKMAKVADSLKLTSLAPSVSIASDKVIDKATVKLAYAGADFAEGVDKKGAVTASATISF